MNPIPDGEYRLLTYRDDGSAVAGVLVGEDVHRVADLVRGTQLEGSSVLGLLEDWPNAHQALAEAAAGAAPGTGTPLDQVELLAPVIYPRAVFCTGANYWDHIAEMEGTIDRSNRAKEPWFFLKSSAHSIVGPGAAVRPPTPQLDWEAELGVVVGTTARDVPAERAAEVIAGYTIVNDLSARDLMTRDDRPPSMTFDWVGQKCFDGAAPMGPWMTPAAFIPDPHALSVRLWVNDTLKQDSHTSQLVHDIYEQIEWLSHHLTLLPGDIVSTGTPAGVGMPRGEYLRRGDVVRIEIEGCGRLVTPIA